MVNKFDPSRIVVNFLRKRLTDPNSGRTTQWIFPDFPRSDLTTNSYPRIGVTEISDSSQYLGIWDDNKSHTVDLQIDIVTQKD